MISQTKDSNISAVSSAIFCTVGVESTLATQTLTSKQHVVLEFIQRYMSEHQCSPLIREIQLGCQILSYKSAVDRLNALEHKGFIKRAPNKHRGIKLLRRAVAAEPAVPQPPVVEVTV